MAYETGSASGIGDLIGKLSTFLQGLSPAWTEDEYDNSTNYRASLHKDNVYVHFQWASGTPEDLGIFQSLGYTGGMTPDDHPDDSGAGNDASVTTGRHVNFENGGSAFTAYYFFASETAPYYCHVVVEVEAGRFRHFGFGNLDKIGTWTGGEYCWGFRWDQSTSYIDVPGAYQHAAGPCITQSATSYGPTLHIEGLPNMNANSKWGFSNYSTTSGTDPAGYPRYSVKMMGRGCWWTSLIGSMRVTELNAYKPLTPLLVTYYDTTPSPALIYPLGYIKDMRCVNIGNLSAGDEITIGSDTWKVFPIVRKQYTLGNVEESYNGGWAYRKFA